MLSCYVSLCVSFPTFYSPHTHSPVYVFQVDNPTSLDNIEAKARILKLHAQLHIERVCSGWKKCLNTAQVSRYVYELPATKRTRFLRILQLILVGA